MSMHVNDVGTVFDLTLEDTNGAIINLTGHTSLKFYILKPSGDLLQQDATVATDGTDGIVRYVTIPGDFDEAGNFKVQVKATIPSGSWSSDELKVKVKANIYT